MPYDNMIDRDDVAGLIPMEYSNELLDSIEENSWVMKLGRRLRNMSRGQETLPVKSALATAYFLNGDSGLIQTSEINWDDKVITAEKVGVIVPIPENIIDDANVPIWDEIMPELRTACGETVDKAVLNGTGMPASWNTTFGGAGIAAVATAKGNSVVLGSGVDIYDDILGEEGLFSKLENDGIDVNGSIAHTTMKAKLRGARDADGQPIFNRDPAVANQYLLDGSPLYFPKNGSAVSTTPLISGDWDNLVYSVRRDFYWKILEEAALFNAAGELVYSLAQQDMKALRVIMRLGFALPNRINRVNTNSDTRYPFAILKTA